MLGVFLHAMKPSREKINRTDKIRPPPHKTHCVLLSASKSLCFFRTKRTHFTLLAPSSVPFRSLPMYILSVFSPSRFLRCDLGVSSSGLHAQKALASTSYLIMCVNAMIVMDGEIFFSTASDGPKCRFIAIT